MVAIMGGLIGILVEGFEYMCSWRGEMRGRGRGRRGVVREFWS